MESELGAAFKTVFQGAQPAALWWQRGAMRGGEGSSRRKGYICIYISVFLLSRFLSFLRIHFVPLILPVSTLPLLVPWGSPSASPSRTDTLRAWTWTCLCIPSLAWRLENPALAQHLLEIYIYIYIYICVCVCVCVCVNKIMIDLHCCSVETNTKL